MPAIAARRPISCQVGAEVVLTMSAASWNVRPATSHLANMSHTARRSVPFAPVRTATRTIPTTASTDPIAMVVIAIVSASQETYCA